MLLVKNSTVEPGLGQPSGTSCVTTNAGPHACWPPQPSAASNVRRPVSIAPSSAIRPLRCSALGSETRNVISIVGLEMGISSWPEKYHSNTSSTPSFASATYPSSDIDMSATTLAIGRTPWGSDRLQSDQAVGRVAQPRRYGV